MGCVESAKESPAKRAKSTTARSVNNGSRPKTSQKQKGPLLMNSLSKWVEIGTQTEESAEILLRRLSSRIKQRHRRSTRGQKSAQPPDKTLLFDLNRTVELSHSKISLYIDKALSMPGEQNGLDSSQRQANGFIPDDSPVSDRDKNLLQECWKVVQRDLVEFGVDLFVRLLEENPSVRDLFPFGKLNVSPEKLQNNKDLRAHGQRVMETIGTVVEGLDDWELVEPILEDLGARHKTYGATPEHFSPLEEAFMFSMKNGLPPKVFTGEVQDAWRNLWTPISSIMSRAMRGNAHYDLDDGEGPISSRDRQLVQGSWVAIQKDLVNLGAALFVRLLGQNPSIKQLFPFGKLNLSPEKLESNPDLRAHGKGVMETVGLAVENLDNPVKLVPILKDLGSRHQVYGAKPEHFKPFAEAYIHTLKNGLPPKVFTSEVEEAWGHVLGVVSDVMSSTMSDESVPEPVSAKDKRLVQGSWKFIQKDLVNIGAILFTRFFEQNPSTKQLFPFGKLNLSPEKLKSNPELRAHGKGVMETIGLAVENLDDPDKLVAILKDLGSRHQLYGAKPEHFKPLAEAFNQALKDGLPPIVFTLEVQEAWGHVFKVVADVMSSTMSGGKGAGPVSARDKRLVRESWKFIQKDLVNIGALLFTRFFEQNPSIKQLFPFGKLNLSPEKLKSNPELRAHGKGVMETIGLAVENLDNPDKLVPILKDLGSRHQLYGANPEHFQPLTEALMHALKDGMSPKVFTSDVQEAWEHVFKVVADVMSSTMSGEWDAGPVSARDKRLVQASWKFIQKDLVNIGALLFTRFLGQNPSIKQLFSFGKLNLTPEKLKSNPELRAHGKGVMETVGLAVENLDNPDELVAILKDLGARHQLYGAKPEHFKPLTEAFMHALKDGLPPKIFTLEVQEAWGHVFKVVADVMSSTMSGECDAGPVSAKDKRLVQGSWKFVQKDLVNIGALLFTRFFEQNPSIKQLFPFGKLNLSPEKLKSNPELRAHGKGVMETIGLAVENLDSTDKLVPILKDLGSRHQVYGAKPEHFKPLLEAFMHALKNGLSPKVLTSEVQEAWGRVLKVVADVMSSTMGEESDSGPVSSRDKRLVQGSWKYIQKDSVNIGALLFVRFLEQNPSIKQLFPFGKLNLSPEKLKSNPELRAHGKGVMEIVGLAVENLDNPDKLVPILKDLGKRHQLYGAKPEHFKPLSEAFMDALKDGVSPKVFTPEVQEAWGHVFKVVADVMSTTMSEESDSGPVSSRDKRLVQGSWKYIQKDSVNIGALLFVRFLEQNPSIKQLFPFGKLNLSPEKLKSNPELRAHGKGVMETIGLTVENLDNPDKLVPILKDLGTRHQLYGARPEHFKPLSEAFMHALKNGLSPKVLTSEVQEAWGRVLKVVADIMSSTMGGESDLGPVSSRDKRLVQGSWKYIQKDSVNIGALLFVRFLEQNPSIKQLFPFGKLNLSPEKLKSNPELRAHGKGVMEVVGLAVENLDNPDKLVPVLKDLGTRHQLYGARPEHFKPLSEAFMDALKDGVSPKVFTPEVQEAWRHVFKVVADVMSTTMSGELDAAPLSVRDKRLVQGSWKFIQKDMTNIGAVLFTRLLEKNPSIQSLFTFGKLNLPPEKLKHNPDLKAHGKGVMETIGAVVAGLDDVGKIAPTLKDLGARHKIYGAKPEHFPAVVEAFMYSLKSGLPPKVFTSEVQEAWTSTLKVVAETMCTTMRGDVNGPLDDEPISPRERRLIQKSWKAMQKDMVNLGAALFARFLDRNPHIRDLFPFGKSSIPAQMLKHNSDLRTHAKGVMETIGIAVEGLDDLDKVIPILKELGARHMIYGARPEHFQPLEEAFMYAMRNGLSSKVFTSEVQQAWRSLWKVVAGDMSTTMT